MVDGASANLGALFPRNHAAKIKMMCHKKYDPTKNGRIPIGVVLSVFCLNIFKDPEVFGEDNENHFD